jgi:hypothetical protein
MSLTTFGAIMGFAVEIIGQTIAACEALIERTNHPALKEMLQGLAGEEEKNRSLMEKARREHVTEMILEPITGLHEGEYEIGLKDLGQKHDADLMRVALMLLEREKKFFQDASIKIPLPEVARIFKKISQKKEETLEKLRALGLNLI